MYIRSSPRRPNKDPNRTLSNELLLNILFYYSIYILYLTIRFQVISSRQQYFNIESSSQFFLEYRDKLAASIRDNYFRKSIEFLYITQEQLGNSRLGQAIKYLILDSWPITTIMFIQPLLSGRSIIKLINISFHLQSRIGSSFRSPLYALYKALAYQQVQQLETYFRVVLYIFGQQYSRQSSSRVFPRPRQPATSRSYTYLRSLSLSLS